MLSLCTPEEARTIAESAKDIAGPTIAACYNKLPDELKIQIWENVLRIIEPQAITIRNLRVEWARKKDPAILEVDSVSRHVALEQYSFYRIDGRPLYFNYTLDVLRINQLALQACQAQDCPIVDKFLSNVQNLTILADDLQVYHGPSFMAFDGFLSTITKCPQLRSLCLAIEFPSLLLDDSLANVMSLAQRYLVWELDIFWDKWMVKELTAGTHSSVPRPAPGLALLVRSSERVFWQSAGTRAEIEAMKRLVKRFAEEWGCASALDFAYAIWEIDDHEYLFRYRNFANDIMGFPPSMF